MQELYRSDLLQALGWAIADSLWQMSLLWLIYQLSIAIPFRQKPAVKHLGAVLTLLTGTCWFFYTFIFRFAKERSLEPTIGSISSGFSFSFTNLLNSTLPYFSTAYLAILVLLFFRLVYHFMATQKLKMELKPAIEWQHVVNRLTVSLGISREIFIYISEQINVPSTLGYLKPVILLPVATVNQLSVEQLEAVIIHEMAHIRRNDYLVNLLVAFIETILFFNPFAHLLGRAIRKECELCCDDEVIRQQDPAAYAQALLLLEQAKISPALVMAATGKQGLLLGRVKRILNIPDQDVKYRYKVLTLVVLAGMIMVTGLLTPSKVSEQSRETTNVIAQQVSVREHDRAPLPFMVNISTNQPAIQKESVIKAKKNKPAPQKQIETPVVSDVDFEFSYHPDPPLPPVAPVPPPPHSVDNNSERIHYRAPMNNLEGYIKLSGAPDPRDRRSPGILKDERIKMAQDLAAASPGYYEVLKHKALQLEALENLEGSIAKVRSHPEQFSKEFEFNTMVETMISSQVDKKKQRVQLERKKSTEKKITKPAIRTIAVENGMTITIIQDEAQIEITVKDNR